MKHNAIFAQTAGCEVNDLVHWTWVNLRGYEDWAALFTPPWSGDWGQSCTEKRSQQTKQKRETVVLMTHSIPIGGHGHWFPNIHPTLKVYSKLFMVMLLPLQVVGSAFGIWSNLGQLNMMRYFWGKKKIFLRETKYGVSFSSLGQCYFCIWLLESVISLRTKPAHWIWPRRKWKYSELFVISFSCWSYHSWSLSSDSKLWDKKLLYR